MMWNSCPVEFSIYFESFLHIYVFKFANKGDLYSVSDHLVEKKKEIKEEYK